MLGLDLNDWLRGDRHWGDFWELYEQLEDGSAYRAALLEDRDLAEKALEQPTPDPVPASLRGYTPLMAKLDDVLDALYTVAAAAAHANPSDIPSVERPKPEIDYVRAELTSESLGVVVAYLLR